MKEIENLIKEYEKWSLASKDANISYIWLYALDSRLNLYNNVSSIFKNLL